MYDETGICRVPRRNVLSFSETDPSLIMIWGAGKEE